MSVSPDYLTATSIVCAVAREAAPVEVIVNMSQMTVSQMTLTSTSESNQHRLHWLAEHIVNWSGVPVVHVRPTVFLDNPLFTVLAADVDPRSRRARARRSGAGARRRSPPPTSPAWWRRCCANPQAGSAHVYELTGPEVLDVDGIAEQYSRALGRPVIAQDVPLDEWSETVLRPLGLPPHVAQHIATMARLHREDRYDRSTDDVDVDHRSRRRKQWSSTWPRTPACSTDRRGPHCIRPSLRHVRPHRHRDGRHPRHRAGAGGGFRPRRCARRRGKPQTRRLRGGRRASARPRWPGHRRADPSSARSRISARSSRAPSTSSAASTSW